MDGFRATPHYKERKIEVDFNMDFVDVIMFVILVLH